MGMVDRYNVIENDKIVNIVEATPDFAAGKGWQENTGQRKGDEWDGNQWVTPTPPVTVPERVTALQGMLALEQFGLEAAFEAWAGDPARTFKERAFLDKAEHWRRNSETIETARVDMGLTSQQVDEMFIAAEQIEP